MSEESQDMTLRRLLFGCDHEWEPTPSAEKKTVEAIDESTGEVIISLHTKYKRECSKCGKTDEKDCGWDATPLLQIRCKEADVIVDRDSFYDMNSGTRTISPDE